METFLLLAVGFVLGFFALLAFAFFLGKPRSDKEDAARRTAHKATCDELKCAWAENAELIQTLSDWTLHDQKQKEEIAELKERISKAQDALDGVDEWDVDDQVILAGDAD